MTGALPGSLVDLCRPVLTPRGGTERPRAGTGVKDPAPPRAAAGVGAEDRSVGAVWGLPRLAGEAACAPPGLAAAARPVGPL